MSNPDTWRGTSIVANGHTMKTIDAGIYYEIVNGAAAAIFVVDSGDNRVLDANPAAAALLAYERENLVGKHVLDLFPLDQRETMKRTIAAVNAGGAVHGIPCSLMQIAGHEVRAVVSAHGITRDDMNGLAIFAFAANLPAPAAAGDQDGEVASLQEALADAQRHIEQSDEANLAKSHFIANLAHELRTPLNALIGMSSLLQDMELADEPREAVEIVASSAKGLLGLINDVLDFARIEAGKMNLRREPYDLRKTLQSVSDTFSLQVRDRGLRYSVDVGRGLPSRLIGDAGRLRQVLVNLVGNALKFTDEGGVTVEVRREDSADEGPRVRFSIVDTGCGIKEADVPLLFEAFSRVGGTAGDDASGTGLGLAISRDLVQRMGGRIGVTSRQGWGSTFWFSLPLLEAPAVEKPAPAPEVVPAAAAPVAVDKLHILIAEDNKVNQKVAQGMVHKLGHSMVAADNGRHALELLATGRFDIVLMDLQMPEMGGLEATRQIRVGAAGEQNRDIPIIAMTGHATRQDRQACLNAGMNGYLSKPISSERISEAIEALYAATPGPTGRGAPFEMSRLVSQMNGDRELAVEILEIFRSDTHERLQRVGTCVRNYDFDSVRDEARAIEGGALNVCSEVMVELAAELHRAATNKEQEYAASVIDEMAVELAAMVSSESAPATR